MLNEEQLLEVKEDFTNLLKDLTIYRKGSDVDGLIEYLEQLGFFTAPASTKSHCSFPGGLCLHSLNVYYALDKIVKTFEEETKVKYDYATLLIVGLLHDVIRANLFEEYYKNEKVYSNYGKKKDELGYFDWVSSKAYKVKDAEERETLGSRGFASYYIISNFIPLTKEETITLVNQYNAFDTSNSEDISAILAKYPLSVYLHMADTVATYCIEK